MLCELKRLSISASIEILSLKKHRQYAYRNIATNNIVTDTHKVSPIGKLEIVKREMERTGIEIMGVSELRWKDKGHFVSDVHKVFYSGHEKHKERGTAIICGKEAASAVLGYNPVSDRIITLRIQGRPANMSVVQVYAPTAEAEEAEHDEFYGKLQDTLTRIPKGNIIIVMGDFNAKVGADPNTTSKCMGKYGLGKRNEAGERLIEFCESNELRITNTWFPQPKRRLYTWTSPGGKYRNQIDYVLINKR